MGIEPNDLIKALVSGRHKLILRLRVTFYAALYEGLAIIFGIIPTTYVVGYCYVAC